MVFLTSFSPSHINFEAQQIAWKSIMKIPNARLISFNCKEEADKLRRFYPGLEINIVSDTTEAIYGRPHVRISSFLNWVRANRDIDCFCLINSDIICDATPSIWNVIEDTVKNGSAVIGMRYDFTDYGNILNSKIIISGIDVIMLHRNHLQFFEIDDIYAMGQPWWDYLIPYTLFVNGVRTCKIVNTKVFYHKTHKYQWNEEIWFMLAKRFAAKFLESEMKSLNENRNWAFKHSHDIFSRFTLNAPEINFANETPDVHIAFRQILKDVKNPIIFDIGAHKGEDARTLSHIKGSTIYAFEPDERNQLVNMPQNVIVERQAIGNKIGTIDLYTSDMNSNIEWSQSSSIKKPTGHLEIFPTVSFNAKKQKAKITTLDAYCQERMIKKIDFIHADVQGAEMDMLIGGRNILKNTRFAYVEYSNVEQYEGQPNLEQILDELKTYSVVKDFGTDVLLVNNAFKG